MQDEDPDEKICIPERELRAALGLADVLLAALNANLSLADNLAAALPQLPKGARFPEVGEIGDRDRLRLHLLRLADRLAPYVPGAVTGGRSVDIPVEKIGRLRVRRPSRAMALQGDDYDLASFFVWWDDITAADVDQYFAVLESAKDEKPLQRHLARNPLMLVQHFRGGHGRWVLPQKRLGSEYVPDFIIGERSSSGFEWQFIELQSPHSRLFVPSNERFSPQLDEGIRQIEEWRRWVDNNRSYARNPVSQDGLGLRNVSGDDPGLLLIGREADLDDTDRERRRQLSRKFNIQIHTYDWLPREAETRIRDLSRYRSQIK